MYFLLNDVVFSLRADEVSPNMIGRRFGAVGFDFVQALGQELFAEEPLVHRTHPERAIKLAALIQFKAPSINAALFVAPSSPCRPSEVGVRFASLDVNIIAALQSRHADGGLTPTIADREVWRRMAA